MSQTTKETKYCIFNNTDGIYLTDKIFDTQEQASNYITKWRIDFRKVQSYYLTGRWEKIPLEDVNFQIKSTTDYS